MLIVQHKQLLLGYVRAALLQTVHLALSLGLFPIVENSCHRNLFKSWISFTIQNLAVLLMRTELHISVMIIENYEE